MVERVGLIDSGIFGLDKDVQVVLADPEGSGLYNKIKFGVMFDAKESEGTKRRHQVRFTSWVFVVCMLRLMRCFVRSIQLLRACEYLKMALQKFGLGANWRMG